MNLHSVSFSNKHPLVTVCSEPVVPHRSRSSGAAERAGSHDSLEDDLSSVGSSTIAGWCNFCITNELVLFRFQCKVLLRFNHSKE